MLSEEERKERQEVYDEMRREREANRARMAHALGLLRPDTNGLELLILDNRICDDAVVADWRYNAPREHPAIVTATAFDYVEQATPEERLALRRRLGV
jgi:hypothetical protein